jgi:hypothetical protein
MSRIAPSHTILAARSLRHLAVAILVAGALLFGATAAHAAFGTPQCLAAKLKSWGNLRKCQRNGEAKLVQGKPADLAKCQTKFNAKLAALNAKAAAAAIACRYRDNGDSTITDHDTGLMWEKKNAGNVLDVFSWTDAMTVLAGLNCTSADGTTLGCSLYHDWRLPKVNELVNIVDLGVAGCGFGSPCIDPVFGPTSPSADYWSSTTYATNPLGAWYVNFGGGQDVGAKTAGDYVRAVRGGL